METQELFKFLPSEVTMGILSKLPFRTISICKCVCKQWLHLIETQEFIKLHLSSSLPGLVTFEKDHSSSLVNFFEVEDGLDVERHDLHYNLVTNFDFPHDEYICGSVDGLIWLHHWSIESDFIKICNPITRDYIKILGPPEVTGISHHWVAWGFGSCKMSGQYKVVCILLENIDKETCDDLALFVVECHVYTLGTGSGWRKLAPLGLHFVSPYATQPGAFVNGNLHWLGWDSDRCLWISRFDLESEGFSSFSAPPLGERRYVLHGDRQIDIFDGGELSDFFELFALGESLCLTDATSVVEVIIWLLEDYENTESWTKKLVINRQLVGCPMSILQPIKIFKDGDILMELGCCMLFYYSAGTKTVQRVDRFIRDGRIRAISHIPSFLSLKSFEMENVSSF